MESLSCFQGNWNIRPTNRVGFGSSGLSTPSFNPFVSNMGLLTPFQAGDPFGLMNMMSTFFTFMEAMLSGMNDGMGDGQDGLDGQNGFDGENGCDGQFGQAENSDLPPGPLQRFSNPSGFNPNWNRPAFNPGWGFERPNPGVPFNGQPLGNSTQARMVSMGRNMLGMDENRNNGALRQFLGLDPSRTPWCVGYYNALYRHATGSKPPWGDNLSAGGVEDWARRHGQFISANQARCGQGPSVGDGVVLYSRCANSKRHFAMVQEVGNGYVKILEGNASNQVRQRTIRTNDPSLVGFVAPRRTLA